MTKQQERERTGAKPSTKAFLVAQRKIPGDRSLRVYGGGESAGSWSYMQRARSGDVIRSDTRRRGSNRMEDKDRRTYNDQVLTDRRFGP